jgi:hypothetical protein
MALREAIIEAERACAKGRDLKQAARDHDVLEKVNHLILVGEVVVKRRRCRNRKDCQRNGDEANLITCDQQKPATA